MGADKLAKNTPNISAQIVCPSPKVLDFDEKKASLGVRSPWATVCHEIINLVNRFEACDFLKRLVSIRFRVIIPCYVSKGKIAFPFTTALYVKQRKGD